jgi:hypothetical protein
MLLLLLLLRRDTHQSPSQSQRPTCKELDECWGQLAMLLLPRLQQLLLPRRYCMLRGTCE